MNSKQIQQDILIWYDQQKRILPWRDNTEPYRVWISEIMLQQTRVDTVIPYFERFIKQLPTIYDLALVQDDELNKLWEGLGYYSRVRNLKKAAQKIVDELNGVFPSSYDKMISLPGIGPYTAGAISSIAFNQPYTAVDGNVLRVFARITGTKTDIKDPHTKTLIKDTVKHLLPIKRVGDFNQALMEIGATVCRPNGKPDCFLCSVQSHCTAYQENLTEIIPMKQIKRKRRVEELTVLVIEYNNQYLIEKRPDKGLLASLYQFPNKTGKFTLNDIKLAFKGIKSIKKLPFSKHIFTHLEWHMVGYHIILEHPMKGLFVSKEDIRNTYSIPTAFRTYKQYLLGGSHE